MQCTAYCGCDDDEECRSRGHRDCKELDKCTECYEDLCSDCYKASKVCKECVRKSKCVYVLVHYGEKVTQIGVFSTHSLARYIALDEDVEDFYRGSLESESFKIHEMQVITADNVYDMKEKLRRPSTPTYDRT